mmetsp:Transcript_71153/g.212184  ORF Transcript_71153/g.212184 Transcript_71153/m.212184 type:complete len:200 (+) Transcript_71153:89-688(+)
MVRFTIAMFFPVCGPLLTNMGEPTQADIGKLYEVLAIVQALLMSCFVGALTEKGEYADKTAETVFMAYSALLLVSLGFLTSVLSYAHLIMFTEEVESDRKRTSDWWKVSGRYLMLLNVFITFLSAGMWTRSVTTALEGMYGEDFQYGIFRHAAVFPVTVVLMVFVVHVVFLPLFPDLQPQDRAATASSAAGGADGCREN